MSRYIDSGSLVIDQVSFYSGGNRVVGLEYNDINLDSFTNNENTSMVLEDGTSILNQDISPGIIYFNEIPGKPGFYSVRFFPDKIGFWYLLYSYNGSEVIKEYDVKPAQTNTDSLIASFS